MPYLYPDVDELEGHDLVGNAQCAVLVQTLAGAPRAAQWRQGRSVRGQLLLPKGTAIATFEDGVYKNRAHGNHAALYVGQDQGGIWVVDQWKDPVRRPTIMKRHLRFQGTTPDGAWKNAVDNGDSYSVIE